MIIGVPKEIKAHQHRVVKLGLGVSDDDYMSAGAKIAATAAVAIDPGGCFQLSIATNFYALTYIENQVIHQCITNLPSAVARTAPFALNNATLPYIILLAEKGYRRACLNICDGVFTHEYVAKAINQTYVPALEGLVN